MAVLIVEDGLNDRWSVTIIANKLIGICLGELPIPILVESDSSATDLPLLIFVSAIVLVFSFLGSKLRQINGETGSSQVPLQRTFSCYSGYYVK